MQEEWDEPDRFSFEDSDRFDEDSLCSWTSEPESLCNNWRGWKRPFAPLAALTTKIVKKNVTEKSNVLSLTELSARCVASYIPFELVEHVYPPVPEVLQLRIAFWSFPDNEDDIRLYSCLANGSAEEFSKGESLFRERAVKDALQIGFHLSATVTVPVPRAQFNVAVTFDRRRISSCNCTCPSNAYWCSHIVAVCLYRIHMSQSVCLRAPVSESLQRLHREQLQKFAQYLISELPRQILPTAQRLLDELLSSRPTAMNALCGAPDPTAGASARDHSAWYLDERTLRAGVGRILVKFCVPAPVVFSDVNYLSASAPPAAAEWASLLRPLRGREPEGMWNLLSIVREMFRRNDRNAIPLLDIITDECMACEQILVWWYNTKAALVAWSGGGKMGGNGMGGGPAGSTNASQHACSSLCDEVVALWRLAALNPALAPNERETLRKQLYVWNTRVLEKVMKSRSSLTSRISNRSGGVVAGPSASSSRETAPQPNDSDAFPGFTPAIEACQVDWEEYPIMGVTYASDTNPLYHSSFTVFRSADSRSVHQVNCSKAVLNNDMSSRYYHCSMAGPNHMQMHRLIGHRPRLTNTSHPSDHNRARNQLQIADGNRSSASSEGFCENEDIRGDADISDSGSGGQVTVGLEVGPRVGNVSTHDPDVTSGSESQQSGDECNSLYCDGKTSSSGENEDDSEKSVPQDADESILAQEACGHNLQEVLLAMDETNADEWELLFARAEGLYAHGHTKEACLLGARLAYELLAHPPDLVTGVPPLVTATTTPAQDGNVASSSGTTSTVEGEPVNPRRGRRNRHHPHHHGHRSHHAHQHPQARASAALQRVTLLASATLAKCAFLCTVLADYPEHRELMFRVGLFGLELPRPPASTKPLEVKLANQEAELVQLLKKIPPEAEQLELAREKARLLRDGVLRSRGPALLPIALAGFVFDILVQPCAPNETRRTMDYRIAEDEELGLGAAIAALGLKVSVSEAEHPLLCEGTRRQRGELALALLSHCRDRPEQLAAVMNQLLDRDIHQLTKGPMVPAYYAAEGVTVAAVVAASVMQQQPIMMSAPPAVPPASTPVASTPTTTVSLAPRAKERYKGKRAYPSVPNQPSEALAHFMFELAKSVLAKAGGSSSTSLFTQATAGQQHHGPHRGLHMAAFQLGLYALGLHNCVSANWLSRTYSSHVSWITGQAMDIGTPAIAFLVGAWEGQLTPPEAAGIADRASRGRHALAVRAAAELALSVLPHAHALNYNEIQRAVLQCKEQSDAMLERACLTVEGAAKGGGVYPEVLFTVARYWHELFLRHGRPPGAPSDDLEIDHDALAASILAPLNAQPATHRVQPAAYRPPAVQLAPLQPVPYALAAGPYAFAYHAQPIAAYPPLYQIQYSPPPPQYGLAPQYFVPQPVSVVHSGHPSQYAAPPPPQSYNSAAQAPLSSTHANSLPQHVQLPTQVQLPSQMQHAGQVQLSAQVQMSQQVVQHFPPLASSPGVGQPGCEGLEGAGGAPSAASVPPLPPAHQYSPAQLRRLLAAYRVGMLALEMQGRRVHDDRPQNKYGRNPPYGDHVKWLLRIAKKLGPQYLQQFCVCAVNSVVSPFILYELAVEAAHWLARTPLAPMAPAPHSSHAPHNPHAPALQPLAMQHLRGTLAPLVQKCQQMFIQSMHQKLYHLTSNEYDDFVSVVLSARSAFHLTPEGNVQFKEWLQSLKRSKSCKKELWAQINVALQNGK